MLYAISLYTVGRIDVLRHAAKILGIKPKDRLTFFEKSGKLWMTKEEWGLLSDESLATAMRTRPIAPSNCRLSLRSCRTTITNTLPLKYRMRGINVITRHLKGEKVKFCCAAESDYVDGVEALEIFVEPKNLSEV